MIDVVMFAAGSGLDPETSTTIDQGEDRKVERSKDQFKRRHVSGQRKND